MHDKTRGISIHQRAESHLQVYCTDKSWIELLELPFLQSLDISSFESGSRHVYVRQVPELKHISNTNSLSLILHLDLVDHRQALLVEGPIEHFDCCWESGHYSHQGNYPLSQLLLCPIEHYSVHKELIDSLTSDSCVMLFTHSQAELPNTLRLNTSATVVIASIPQLTSLYSMCIDSSVTLHNCPDIREAQGRGGIIALHQSGKNHLSLGGVWKTLELVSCKLYRLTIKEAEKLYLRGLSSVEHAHVPDYVRVINETTNHFSADVFPEVNEATLLQLYDFFRQASNEEQQRAIHLLLGAISKASRRSTLYHSVKLLHAIAEQTDVFDSLIVQTRKTILPKTGWQFPDDLVNEGWQTDVKLWFLLKQRVWKLALNASFETYFFHHASKPSCFYAVLNQAIEMNDEVIVRRILRRVTGLSKYRPLWFTNREPMLTKAYKRLMIALTRLSHPTQVVAIHFIFDAMDKSEHSKQLPRLMQVAAQATRIVAFNKANKEDSLLKSHYLAIALSAVSQGETA